MENLKWEQKEELGIMKLINQIEGMSREVVRTELLSIGAKLEQLEKMGILHDKEQMSKIKEQIEIIRNSNDFSIK